MAAVRERWLSRRAGALHAAVLVVAAGCAAATWWQVTRAADGNQLSYFYSGMWPAFGILAVYFWWSLVHTDFESAGLRGTRRQQAGTLEQSGEPGRMTASAFPAGPGPEGSHRPDPAEDPEMAAYNARLAALARQGPKTWRRPERVVVRRPQ